METKLKFLINWREKYNNQIQNKRKKRKRSLSIQKEVKSDLLFLAILVQVVVEKNKLIE